MTEKKSDNTTAIVIGGAYHISAPRSNLISRGKKIVESLEKMSLTIVKDIIVDIDINGYLKRLAIIDPVKINGEQIKEIYLGFVFNNKKLPPESIEKDDIRIGDTLLLNTSPSNFFDNLPKLVKEKRTGNEKIFKIPDKCPSCGSKIAMPPLHSRACYCTGLICPGRIKAQLIAFSDSMHIDLNDELAKELVDKKIVLDSADLYFLKKEDLMRLNGMSEDSAQRVLDAIEKSRYPEINNLV